MSCLKTEQIFQREENIGQMNRSLKVPAEPKFYRKKTLLLSFERLSPLIFSPLLAKPNESYAII
jgi:hypothetical protein